MLMYKKTRCLEGCLIFFDKEPEMLLWVGSRAARVTKITIRNIRNRLNYREIYTVKR